MKATRTRIFLLIPILFERVPRTKIAITLRAGADRSSLPDDKDDDEQRWRVRHRDGCETHTVPNDLFWTWFVDKSASFLFVTLLTQRSV